MLTKDQKESLKSLVNHPWWDVVEKIEEEARIVLWNQLMEADLDDEKQRNILRENQIYVKARKDFLQNIRNNTTEVYIPVI